MWIWVINSLFKCKYTDIVPESVALDLTDVIGHMTYMKWKYGIISTDQPEGPEKKEKSKYGSNLKDLTAMKDVSKPLGSVDMHEIHSFKDTWKNSDHQTAL